MVMRLIVIGVLVISVAGCGHTLAPKPPAAAKPIVYQCPEGTKLVGAPPPKSYQQGCSKPDGTKHGKYTTWHPNGQKGQEGEIRDGKPHGRWTVWHDNGQK